MSQAVILFVEEGSSDVSLRSNERNTYYTSLLRPSLYTAFRLF